MLALAGTLAPRTAVAAAASPWDQTDVSEVRVVSATEAVGEGDTVRLGLQFRLDPGWKIYWRSPGDAGLPPMPDFEGSDNLASVDMEWPAPERFLELGGLETVGYKNGTLFPLTVRLERPGEALSLRAVIDYQACEKICIPFTATLALDLPAGPAEATPFARLIDRYAAKVPGAPAAAGIELVHAGVIADGAAEVLEVRLRANEAFAAPILLIEGDRGVLYPTAELEIGEDGHMAVWRLTLGKRAHADSIDGGVRITMVDGARAAEFPVSLAVAAPAAMPAVGFWSLATVLGLALLGGLILNLMPCVLPVLSIKLLGVISHGGGERHWVVANFIASASGIVASFLVLAAGAVALKMAGGMVGWGMQFQEPLFLVFLTVVVTLFACNLFGLFEISMPGWIGGLAGGGEGPSLVGSFWTGALATLLATPCSAPFLGTAVGFALSRGAGEIFAVFLALGLGMASPYLLVAAAPGLATRLPKPGPWMIWVRGAMGLTLAATAAWLLWVIAAQTGNLAALVLGALMVIMGLALWLLGAHKPGRGRVALGAMTALALVAFLVPGAIGGRAANTGAVSLDPIVAGLNWRPFDEAAIPSLVRAGRVVFVDVTAEWCVTCKVNKSLVLETAAVAERLSAPHVVAMRADWTRPDPVIARYLATFGRYGIPFNVVYGPGAPDGVVLSELLSRSAVLGALDQARATSSAANATPATSRID